MSERWYGHTLTLGEVDGIPVRTFTNANRLPSEAPKKNYLDVVRKGLTETWGGRLSAARIKRYLEERAQAL